MNARDEGIVDGVGLVSVYVGRKPVEVFVCHTDEVALKHACCADYAMSCRHRERAHLLVKERLIAKPVAVLVAESHEVVPRAQVIDFLQNLHTVNGR